MMLFQPDFIKATEGNRLSITVASNDIDNTKSTSQRSFWQQLMSHLEQNKQITELSLVIENDATYNALFPKGEELGWVFSLSNVRHLLLSTTPQAEDRMSKKSKETNINGSRRFLYPPLSARDTMVKNVVVTAFIGQFNAIKKSLASGEKHIYQTNQALPIIDETPNVSYKEKGVEDNQGSVKPEADIEDWMSFFLRNVAMPEVYLLPLVIGFIALLASNGVGMTIIGGGLFAVGALGAGLHFFSTGEDEFEGRYYANRDYSSNSY